MGSVQSARAGGGGGGVLGGEGKEPGASHFPIPSPPLCVRLLARERY